MTKFDDAQFFYIHLFHFSTCFEQPRDHQQENQLYQYIILYTSLCVGDLFVCRSERKFLFDLHTKRYNFASSWSFTKNWNVLLIIFNDPVHMTLPLDPILNQAHQVHSNSTYWRPILILYYFTSLGFTSGLFPSSFSTSKVLPHVTSLLSASCSIQRHSIYVNNNICLHTVHQYRQWNLMFSRPCIIV